MKVSNSLQCEQLKYVSCWIFQFLTNNQGSINVSGSPQVRMNKQWLINHRRLWRGCLPQMSLALQLMRNGTFCLRKGYSGDAVYLWLMHHKVKYTFLGFEGSSQKNPSKCSPEICMWQGKNSGEEVGCFLPLASLWFRKEEIWRLLHSYVIMKMLALLH